MYSRRQPFSWPRTPAALEQQGGRFFVELGLRSSQRSVRGASPDLRPLFAVTFRDGTEGESAIT